ncbi:hypothetical protein V8F06_002139 [Rhypophila decipiens]
MCWRWRWCCMFSFMVSVPAVREKSIEGRRFGADYVCEKRRRLCRKRKGKEREMEGYMDREVSSVGRRPENGLPIVQTRGAGDYCLKGRMEMGPSLNCS